jgi:hypothetical protein
MTSLIIYWLLLRPMWLPGIALAEHCTKECMIAFAMPVANMRSVTLLHTIWPKASLILPVEP